MVFGRRLKMTTVADMLSLAIELKECGIWRIRQSGPCDAGMNALSLGPEVWPVLMAQRGLRLGCQSWPDSTLSRAIPGYIASGLQYTVGGSAIGYQCLFAATALGFNCTGYELLQCLVADSKSLAGDLSRAVESVDVGFVCGDATKADLSTTGVLWLNDALWPPEVRVNMLLRAASRLQSYFLSGRCYLTQTLDFTVSEAECKVSSMPPGSTVCGLES